MIQVLWKSLLCAIAGMLAWIICEPMFPKTVEALGSTTWAKVENIFIILIGAFIGIIAGLFHGFRQGGRTHTFVSAGLGLIFGIVGASIGHSVAGLAYTMLGGSSQVSGSPFARIGAFVPLGLFMGAAIGGSQRSLRTIISGAIGGLIAGGVTGALFDPLCLMLSQLTSLGQSGQVAEVGAPGRAITSAGLGFFIGLFTSIVDLATRRAWLRLQVARNEGREWVLDSKTTLIGRDERAHIPIFSDPNWPVLAAIIQQEKGQFILQDPGTPMGVGHNGIRVQSAILAHGDTIQIGSLNFDFFTRSGSSNATENKVVSQPVQPIQSPAFQATSFQTVATPAQGGDLQNRTLVVLNGPLTGQRVPINQPIEIGREANGLAIAADIQASRKHSLVTPLPGGAQITDLGSTNGTFVNGIKIQTSLLNQGDIVTIGSTTLKVE